jgi:uncharacterized protein (TIGR03437 family)
MIRYVLPFLLVLSAALQAQEVVVVSAASFATDFPVAPESIASAFGTDLAPGAEAAAVTPLPTVLQGTSVTIIDSAGQSHLCPLFYMSPGQINFLVPPEVALGTATIQVAPAAAALRAPGANQSTKTGELEIAAVSTGLFTVTELNWMSGFILRVDADGTQTYLPTVELNDDGEVVPVPVEMSPGGDETAEFYAILYGTGNRGSGNLETVRTYIGLDESVGDDIDLIPTFFNGPQGDFVGLDQTNAGPISRAMEWFGGGDRPLALEVDGDFSNLAWINVAPNPNAPVITNPSFVLADSPRRIVHEFDFEDADGDMGPLDVNLVWEDATRFCFRTIELGEGPFTGQTSGRLQFFDNKDSGTQLGDILSVSFFVIDGAAHFSNIVDYFPPEGSLPGFMENCDDIIEK